MSSTDHGSSVSPTIGVAPTGSVEIISLARVYDVRARDIVAVAGLPPSAARADRVVSKANQRRLREMAEVLDRVTPLAGSSPAALAWYKAQAIPGFGRTAEQLVKSGHASAVRDYLDEIALGGFAGR